MVFRHAIHPKGKTSSTRTCFFVSCRRDNSLSFPGAMKFGKNIGRVVELSDPEWSPFWINYKFLKKKAKVSA